MTSPGIFKYILREETFDFNESRTKLYSFMLLIVVEEISASLPARIRSSAVQSF